MDAWHRDAQSIPDGDKAPPTLIAHGDLDAVIPVANAAVLASHWYSARVEILSGCAHGLMAQDPKRLGVLIRDLPGA